MVIRTSQPLDFAVTACYISIMKNKLLVTRFTLALGFLTLVVLTLPSRFAPKNVEMVSECNTSTDYDSLLCNGYEIRTGIGILDCTDYGGHIPFSGRSNCYLTDEQYAKFKKDALVQGREFTPAQIHFNEARN